MCGRYVSPDNSSIEREFNLVHTEWRFPSSYNVAPTQQVPVVRSVNGERQGQILRWGLIPFSANGEAEKYTMITARIETVQTAAYYRELWGRGQRCLQVATGFYEWHIDVACRKVPCYVHLRDQPVFAFAGLWDRSVKADGTTVESCVHITIPANALMLGIHNTGNNPPRMPAILHKEDCEAWLTGSVAEAWGVLKQYDASLMAAYEVSVMVNTPKNNSAVLLEPLRPQADDYFRFRNKLPEADSWTQSRH